MKFFLIYLFLLSDSLISSEIVNDILIQNAKSEEILQDLYNYDLKNCKRFNNDNAPNEATFDFIVIGAGSTGSVVASRLSENPQWQVLLLEAGDTNTVFHDIPIDSLVHQVTSSNWGYLSTKQKNGCLGMNNQQCRLARGKVLGGSSGVNYMLYTRGNRWDFDKWADMGATGWSYEEVLPYFIKSEHNVMTSLRYSPYHGHDGPLNVEDNKVNNYTVKFLLASAEAGYYLNPDYSGESQLGATFLQVTKNKGHRHGGYRAFIEPSLNRPNLHVRPSAQVTKILINPNTREAYGVEFVYKNSTRIVYASKEVILSAGALNSPQILMLSGIGPSRSLKKFGLPVIKNLPVGKQLYDHLYFLGLTYTTNITESLNPNITIKDIKNFLNFKDSQLSMLPFQALLFSKTQQTDTPSYVPDVELVYQTGYMTAPEKDIYNLRDDVFDSVFGSLPTEGVFSVGVISMHPKSIGTVELASANPFVLPKVNPNYLSSEEDIEYYIQAIKQIQNIVGQPEYQKVNAQLNTIPVLGCEDFQFGTDNYWRCAIRVLSITVYHYCGTCRMGNVNDKTTIVSPELKVHGIKRLRVADASVMPKMIAAHTNAACYMIGEKVADMIKRQWWY